MARQELTGLSEQDWREWLAHGASVWTSRSHLSERVAAFAPIVLDPREPGPPQLDEALRQLHLPRETKRITQIAIADSIATWSSGDDAECACFFLELAGWFGCQRIETAIRALLSRPIYTGNRAREQLAHSLAFVLCRRVTPEAALSFARRMREQRLVSPIAMIQLIAYAATAAPSSLSQLVKELLPEWDFVGSSPISTLARMLADQVVDRLGAETVVQILLNPADSIAQFLRSAVEANRLSITIRNEILVFVGSIAGR
jgi:hypothetical protein